MSTNDPAMDVKDAAAQIVLDLVQKIGIEELSKRNYSMFEMFLLSTGDKYKVPKVIYEEDGMYWYDANKTSYNLNGQDYLIPWDDIPIWCFDKNRRREDNVWRKMKPSKQERLSLGEKRSE